MAAALRTPALSLLLCLAQAHLSHAACASEEAGCARPGRAGDEPVSLLQTRSEATVRAHAQKVDAEAAVFLADTGVNSGSPTADAGSTASTALTQTKEECWAGCSPPACPCTCPGATPSPTPPPTPPPVKIDYVKHLPNHTSCTPQCNWACKTKICDEVCAPVCDAPKCQTRCKSFDTKACHMECTTPHCAVLCPKRGCPTKNCPACTTKCGDPVCKMACNADPQPCYSVCEQPKCKWQCRAPKHCPEPECKMMCETPKNCMGNTYKKLPALKKGEIEVKSFVPPALLESVSSEKPSSPPAAHVDLLKDADKSGKPAPPKPADARLLQNAGYMNVSYSFVHDSGKHETAQAWLPRLPASENIGAMLLTTEQIDAKLAELMAP